MRAHSLTHLQVYHVIQLYLVYRLESNEREAADFYDWFLSTCYGFMCYWMGREQ